MRILKQKKGAIEMSLNLIIMLIIGLTVLALVIGFVNNLINQGSSSFEEQLSKADEREEQLILDEPGIFAVGPSTFNIATGGKKTLFVKIQNPTDEQITFSAANLDNIIASPVSVDMTGGSAGFVSFEVTSVDLSATCALAIQTSPVSIQPKGEDIIRIILTASNACNDGENFFVTVVFDPDSTGAGVRTKTLSGAITN